MPEEPVSADRSVLPRKSTAQSLHQGKFYALIIGVSNYKYQESLEYPLKDAARMRDLLIKNYFFFKQEIFFLENPTRTEIIDTFDQLEQILKKEDSLLIFYAGHGHWEAKKNRGYWLPRDARIKARAAWISNGTIQDYLTAYACQHVLVISDSCFSGALLMRRSAIKDAEKEIQVLYSAKSRKALTSGVKETVPDRSVFFREMSRFLKKNKKEFLSASELYSGIRNQIIAKSPSNQKPQFGAIADTEDDGGDFIFIKKGTTTSLSLKKPGPFDQLMADPRTKERLLSLRKQLDIALPSKSLSGQLLIATWNIRKFGGNTYGGRTQEALAYIATIIERFDIVAIQEIYGNFKVLDDLKFFLGEHWEYIFSDTSIGLGGSDYRLGYFYDKRKVLQGGITSDLMLPSVRSRDENGRFSFKPATQLLRPPFNCGFKMDGKRLILCNTHLVFGKRQKKQERLKELESILNFWKWRAHLKNAWSKNIILLGNFQTEKLKEKELQMVQNSIFRQSKAVEVPSNFTKNRYYNQMAFHLDEKVFQLSGRGGAFDFFESVFREEDEVHYLSQIDQLEFTDKDGKSKTFEDKSFFYKRFWRTSQMSDNLPLWTELLYE